MRSHLYPNLPRLPAWLRRYPGVPRCQLLQLSPPRAEQAFPAPVVWAIVVSLASRCSKRTRHWLSGNLASGWVLPLPCCVTLASHFPSLGFSFSLCKRKLVIAASLTSTPPDDSAGNYVLLFKDRASACAILIPWNAVPRNLLSKFWFFNL